MSKKSAKSKPLQDARAGKKGGTGSKGHKHVGPRAQDASTSGSWEGKRSGRLVTDRRKATVSASSSSEPASQPHAPKPVVQRPSRPSLLDLIEEMRRGDVKDQERTFEALQQIERTRI